MKHLDLGGLSVPALGFGTWRLSGDACVVGVRRALDLGYRHLDTAAMYGNEVEVGRAVRESGVPRNEITVVTKVWVDAMRRPDLIRSAEASLARLDLGRIDLLLAHWPSRDVPLAESLDAMSELVEGGRVRQIGVANFPVALLRRAREVHGAPIVCNQVEYHPFLSQRRLLEWQRPHGVALIAYCPLAKGSVGRDPLLGAIARRLGATPAQVTLAWLLGQDGVGAIPKAGDVQHARENLAAAGLTLPEADRRAIDGLGGRQRRVDPEFAPAWDDA